MADAVKSAERTLRVFEFFALERRPATAAEIENALGLPQSSTSMLLRSLLDLGYLEQRPGRLYFPTLRLAVLGHWLEEDPEIGFFTRKLEQLRDETGETVMIGRQHGWQIKYVQILPSSQEIQFFMPEGAVHPLCTSASGRALLSRADEAEIDKIVRRHNFEADELARVDREVLQASLETIRRTGVAETSAELGGAKDYHAIAALAPARAGQQQRSIGVAGPRDRVLGRRSKIIETLKASLAG